MPSDHGKACNQSGNLRLKTSRRPYFHPLNAAHPIEGKCYSVHHLAYSVHRLTREYQQPSSTWDARQGFRSHDFTLLDTKY
jgi:hypothetical protein